jgi:hypothetical protein
VLKQVIVKAKKENDREAYSSALVCLRIPSPPEWTEEAYWEFAKTEINSGEPPSFVALDRLMEFSLLPRAKASSPRSNHRQAAPSQSRERNPEIPRDRRK